MAYSKIDLLERLSIFKKQFGRYPTRKDFRSKKITPSKNAFYRNFGSMENAFKQVELFERGLIIHEEEKLEAKHSLRKKSRHRCPFCGSDMQTLFDYATCKNYIILRFINLIKKNQKNSDYVLGVYDCMTSVFGQGHHDVEIALGEEGFLNEYLERQEFTHNPPENSSAIKNEK